MCAFKVSIKTPRHGLGRSSEVVRLLRMRHRQTERKRGERGIDRGFVGEGWVTQGEDGLTEKGSRTYLGEWGKWGWGEMK